jgi:hypothetical protein
MAALKLPLDAYCEIDLTEDSEVDRAELEAFGRRGGSIRDCGFRLTVTGAIAIGSRQPMQRAYWRGMYRNRRAVRR